MVSFSPQAFLLVDGYNIIGTWQDLKKTRDKHGLELARRELVEALINFTVLKEFHTQIVFDAHYQKQPGYQETFTPSLSVHYTGFAQTADTYIEKFSASFQNSNIYNYSRLIVATSDNAQKLTVMGYGAEWLSAQRLQSEVEATIKKEHRKMQPPQKSKGRFLFNTLDEKSQKKLQQWMK
jgi:uncharacterized protein